MTHDRDVFTFELNESLYFEKGHEVSEMVGISLDPEISIQTYNDYVSIRGVIELQGEYIQANSSIGYDDATVNFEDYQSRRYIERVEEIEEGRATFSHRFPVEISVPLYRVAHLNDVTVSIDSFDYEIPENNQLILKATIDIYGISQENEDVYEKVRDDSSETESLNQAEEVQLDETFEFDIKEERNEDESVSSANSQPDQKTRVEDAEEQPDRWKTKKTQSFAEFFKTDQEKVEETKSEETEETKGEESIDEFLEETSGDIPSSQTSDDELDEDIHSRPDEVIEELDSAIDVEIDAVELQNEDSTDNEEPTDGSEDVRYLADMFRNDDEEDAPYAQMRLCIVQNKDTIETIADRYEISPSQLLKQNRLEDEELLEGQLLYIPIKKIN
ncbi:MAG TPA: stage VI sporulation protein D [Virgibacillus sp.]|nr:stage VI sporulation protein D [Virgibacillus sp.]